MSFQFSPETLLNEIRIETLRLETQIKDSEATNLKIAELREQISNNPPEFRRCNCRGHWHT